MVLTKPIKDKETYASTVAFESCCYIKLEKHKLDQIAERKIRISLDRLEVKLQRLRIKGTRANMISVLYSQTVWFRYVDDTFTLFPNKDTAVQFLSYLNTRH